MQHTAQPTRPADAPEQSGAADRQTAPEAPSRSPLRLALASPAAKAGLWAAAVVAAVQAVGLVLVADAWPAVSWVPWRARTCAVRC